MIPNVLWIPEGVIFWDTDQNIRLIPNHADSTIRQTVVAEFECSILVRPPLYAIS